MKGLVLMELNKYIFDVAMGDERLLVNLTNGIVVMISNQEYINMLKYPNKVSESVWSALSNNRFILPASENKLEIDYDKYCAININITNSCNFMCKYCYFKANNETRATVSIDTGLFMDWFTKTVLPKKKKVFINFLGGEPLIEARKILLISETVNKLTRDSAVGYFGEITTNGYFLTPQLATNLSSAGIKAIQITIDGDRDAHNTIRNSKNDKCTYDRILQNVKLCSEVVPITIRVNVNKETNAASIRRLLIDLRDAGVMNVYFAAIEDNYIDQTDSVEHNEYSLSEDETLEKYIEAWTIQREMGFSLHQKFPPVVSNCIARNPNGYTVNYDGRMYLCPSTCGMSQYYVDDLYHYYGNKKITRHIPQKCIECSVYPICMGGCEIINRVQHKDHICKKEYITKLLTYYYKIKFA